MFHIFGFYYFYSEDITVFFALIILQRVTFESPKP